MNINLTKWYSDLTIQRKVEFISVISSCLIVFVSCVFLVTTNKPTAAIDKATIQKLVVQRNVLEKNSESLIKAVENLNSIVKRNNIKDSIVSVLISQQSDLIPNINTRLNEIDKTYKNISAISNYTSAELKKYVADEAAKLRDVPANKRD